MAEDGKTKPRRFARLTIDSRLEAGMAGDVIRYRRQKGKLRRGPEQATGDRQRATGNAGDGELTDHGGVVDHLDQDLFGAVEVDRAGTVAVGLGLGLERDAVATQVGGPGV